MEEEKKLILKLLQGQRVTYIMQALRPITHKCATRSMTERKRGNMLYFKKKHTAVDHEAIWKFYTRSIAYAPIDDSDDLEALAFGYGNRSAFFFHIGKFQESLNDIDKALKFTKLRHLKKKLRDRKKRCLLAMEINDMDFSRCSLIEVDNSFRESQNLQTEDTVEEMLSTIEKEDPFEFVHARYNNKYGRHLTAKRAFVPGEIIMSVKPSVCAVNFKNQGIFCGNCLKTTWNSIPCDYCSWCMFCSEKCKHEAFEKYHDIECNVVPYFVHSETALDYMKQLSLRLVIMALKEAGGIDKLRKELSKVDNTRLRNRGFIDGKFHNDKYQSIFSLAKDVTQDNLETLADETALTLIYLAKASPLFTGTYKTKEDLSKSEEVIFIGSLFLRYMRICRVNALSVSGGSSSCRFSYTPDVCATKHCCERGICIAAIPSLTNHSCFPNIRKIFTEDMRLVIYAVQPIQKNDQLMDSYVGFYFQIPKTIRQLNLKQSFNFECDCIACTENWPTISLDKDCSKCYKEENSAIEGKYLEKYNDFLESIDNNFERSDLPAIEYLSDCITEAAEELVQPCHATPLLMSALCIVCDKLFGCQLKVTGKCYL